MSPDDVNVDMSALIRQMASRPGGLQQADVSPPGPMSPREGGRAGFGPDPAIAAAYPPDDGSSQPIDVEIDPRFIGTVNRNPGGEEAGGLYVSPEAEQWLQINVVDKGLFVDWGTREIYDPETGEVFGTVPTHFPKMT